MKNLFCVMAAAILGIASSTAAAQVKDFPSRPIRIVVPVPPGGSVDAVARLIAQKMSETVGQTVLIDNRPGASTNIGTELVARAAGDGYTLLANTIAFVANPSLFPKILAPASISPDLVRILHEHVVRSARAPDVSERLVKDGAEVVASSPEQFGKTIAAEVRQWAKVIKQAGIGAD